MDLLSKWQASAPLILAPPPSTRGHLPLPLLFLQNYTTTIINTIKKKT